jgi:hypothetical protein
MVHVESKRRTEKRKQKREQMWQQERKAQRKDGRETNKQKDRGRRLQKYKKRERNEGDSFEYRRTSTYYVTSKNRTIHNYEHCRD